MSHTDNKAFGALITRLIQKEDLSRNTARSAFIQVLSNSITPMQQGAFLAALAAKGETRHEVAGAWEAIYDLDTTKVCLNPSIRAVENSGTGMDTFKTFNISTAAAVVGAAGGVHMARHGARAITSVCGTVDMAESLGVAVECPADIVAKSIESAGLGLFNGMSPFIHPMALGRILSQIHFGSTLNIAASLANPALPSLGVRGVSAKEMIQPVTQVMKEIGYTRAIVLYGTIDGSEQGMDEASICGITHCASLQNGQVEPFAIDPGRLGIKADRPDALVPENDMTAETRRFVTLLDNRESGPRKDAVMLNAGLIFLVSGAVPKLEHGIEKAARLIETGRAFETLEKWVKYQNMDPEKGLNTLYRMAA